MRKLQKAAVVTAMVGSVGLFGSGTAVATMGGGPSVAPSMGPAPAPAPMSAPAPAAAGIGTDIGVEQKVKCKSHDTNVTILGNIGVLNAILGGLIGNEGDTGNTTSKQGSTQACHAKAL
ncbi:hypothetical protein [Streptomyces sp. KR80]|uniref:hypothetical protein n=1 Tax=Streptomyces sp. KR80 TaxID=3457426 RepID=UPI003FD2B577